MDDINERKTYPSKIDIFEGFKQISAAQDRPSTSGQLTNDLVLCKPFCSLVFFRCIILPSMRSSPPGLAVMSSCIADLH